MNKVINIFTFSLSTFIGAAVLYAAIVVGVPFLKEQTRFAKERPTIDSLTIELNTLKMERDSLVIACKHASAIATMSSKIAKDQRIKNDQLNKKYERVMEIFSESSEAQIDAFIKSYEK